MWLDMARRGQDASDHCFEITDTDGQILIELPFTEVLVVKGPAPPPRTIHRHRHRLAIVETTTRSRALAAEIAALVIASRKTLEETQRVLQRSRLSAF